MIKECGFNPHRLGRADATFCTDQQRGALSIILTFMLPWSMESTFEEARAHLGIETRRQWSDVAIGRTTPLLLYTYSLLTLIGTRLASDQPIVVEQTAWYRKPYATFHNVLAAVRLLIWAQQSNPTAGRLDCSLVLCLIGCSMLPVLDWKCTNSS